MNRPLLVNEYCIDISRKTLEEIRKEAVVLIDEQETLMEYGYTKPAKEKFYSWVYSDGLRGK